MRKPVIWCHDAFSVRPSTLAGAGLGLFAERHIHIEDTIGYYTGEIITAAQLEAGLHSGSDYILWVTRNHIIVGEGQQANYTRFINHNHKPNAFLIVSTRWKSARFEAIYDIRPGEEIFFNYGEEYWKPNSP